MPFIEIITDSKSQTQLNKVITKKMVNDCDILFIKDKNIENTKNIKLLRGKKILILDDIITTGTTISEMVSTLRSADYHVVKAFTASCSEFNIN
mgnify:CR=1 FL=1